MSKGGDILQNVGMILAPNTTQGILNAPLMAQQRARMLDSGNALDQIISGLSGKGPAQSMPADLGQPTPTQGMPTPVSFNPLSGPVNLPPMKMSTQTIAPLPPSFPTGRNVSPAPGLPPVPEMLTDHSQPQPQNGLNGSANATPLTGGFAPGSGMASFMQNQLPGLALRADPESMIKGMQQRAITSQLVDSIPGITDQQRAILKVSGPEGMKAFVENSAQGFPTVPDSVKLLSTYNNMADSDPRKPLLKMQIDKNNGLETDPDKIAETRASTGEKGANTALAGAKLKLIQDSGLDDDTLSRIYDGVHAGQKITDIYPNIGRGNQGQAQSTQIQKYITNRMKAEGMTQAQIASAQVNLKAQTGAAAMAAKRGTGIDIGADELQTFGDQALEAADNLGNGNFVPWNKLSNMAEESISDPKLASLKTALQGVKGAYATILTRGGANNVDAQKKSDDLLNGANGIPAIKAVIAQMKREATGAKAATVNVQGDIGARIAGGSPMATREPNAAATAPAATPPAGVPSDAQMGTGADGKPGWFSPDPARPGKFLQWQ